MNVQVARNQPWQPEQSRLALRGGLVVRLRAGEDPEHIPSHHDVVAGLAAAAGRVDGGAIDRTIRRFSPAVHVTRNYHSARHLDAPGKRHSGWDDVEQSLGLSRTFRLLVDPDASVVNLADALGSLGTVESVSPTYVCETPFAAHAAPRALPDAGWGHAMVHSAEALAMEPGDTAQIVGIVDSGAALDHPELSGRLRTGVNVVDVRGEHFSRSVKLVPTSGDKHLPMDNMGHGTSCAGIIGANGRRVPRGVAGASRVLPVRALTAAILSDREAPTAVGAIPDINAGLKAAIDLGARVINCSFGTPASALRPDDPTPHVEMVRYALARDVILVVAAGNAGDEVPYYPAALPGVIAVASIGPGRTASVFSSRGAHVAIAAPGEVIPCAVLGGGYERSSGTSFAAPFVAAACALILGRAARLGVPLSGAAVREILVRSASPFAPGAPAGIGAGILDVAAALRATDELVREERAQEEEDDATTDSAPSAAHGGRRGRSMLQGYSL